MKNISEFFWFLIDLFLSFACVFITVVLISSVCSFIDSSLIVIKEEANKKYYYVDLEGNKGEAKFCNRDMSCVTLEDKRILVKEWYCE